VKVRPDLTLPGHPEVFVVGDMIALDDLPGVAQVAIQGGKYAAKTIRGRLEGKPQPGPFTYFDKGSMATISRFRAVANVGKLELRGFIAWLAWLFIHILYLVGFQQKLSTLGHWTVAFLGRARAERTFTVEQSRGALTNTRGPRDRTKAGGGTHPELPTEDAA
jgi:NADH dehydrogenase